MNAIVGMNACGDGRWIDTVMGSYGGSGCWDAPRLAYNGAGGWLRARWTTLVAPGRGWWYNTGDGMWGPMCGD
jgi:hypothetical protein